MIESRDQLGMVEHGASVAAKMLLVTTKLE